MRKNNKQHAGMAFWSPVIMLLFLASGFFATSFACDTCFSATAGSPMRLLQQVSESMLTELKANKSAIKAGNKKIIPRVIRRTLLPHMALDRMAAAVVGRYYWLKASPKDRRLFTEAFIRLVIDTYAVALAAYENQHVRFLPLRGGLGNRRSLTLHAFIVHDNGTKLPMDYQMRLSRGVWKIQDFSVDGVVFTHSYRSQFSGILAQGGLPALIDKLTQHNQRQQH